MSVVRSSPLIIALALIVSLVLLTTPILLGASIPGDWALTTLAVAQRTDLGTHVIRLLTFITSATPALLICLAVTAFEFVRLRPSLPRSRWWAAAWPLITYFGALACNIGLRIAIGRSRPSVDYIPHGLPELQADFQRFSYPSGHAGAAVVAYGVLLVVLWRYPHLRWIAAFACGVVILGASFGRFYLGVHWPTDVLAGWLLGGAWLCVGLYVESKFGKVQAV
jgi:undecaprenyl-diphosphatase